MLLVVPLLVAVAVSPPSNADASPRLAPGCYGAQSDPDGFGDDDVGDLCPGEGNGYFELSVDGDIGSGAAVTIETDVPACTHQDSVTDIFTPDGCYSEIDFDASEICAYLES